MVNLVEFVTSNGRNVAINPDQVVACVSAGDTTEILTVSGVLYTVTNRWPEVIIMLERGH